jgi:hypothetical protein
MHLLALLADSNLTANRLEPATEKGLVGPVSAVSDIAQTRGAEPLQRIQLSVPPRRKKRETWTYPRRGMKGRESRGHREGTD